MSTKTRWLRLTKDTTKWTAGKDSMIIFGSVTISTFTSAAFMSMVDHTGSARHLEIFWSWESFCFWLLLGSYLLTSTNLEKSKSKLQCLTFTYHFLSPSFRYSQFWSTSRIWDSSNWMLLLEKKELSLDFFKNGKKKTSCFILKNSQLETLIRRRMLWIKVASTANQSR